MCGGGCASPSTWSSVAAQSPSLSAGGAEDQVEVPGGEAGGRHRGGDRLGGVRHAPAAEAGQDVRVRRLQAEGDPGHAGPAVGAEVRVVGVLGIALDRHLGTGRARDGVEDAAQGVGVEAGRGAPSEEDGGGRGEVTCPDGALQLEDARVGVALHQVVAVGVGGERAVVAALPAERDVDVDAEGAQRSAVERTERMRRSRWTSMASVASSATSSAAGGVGPDQHGGQVAAEDAAQEGQRGGAHGAPAAVRPAQGAARDEVEGHQLDGAVGLAAGGAGIEDRARRPRGRAP